jgi:cytochrome c551/c552
MRLRSSSAIIFGLVLAGAPLILRSQTPTENAKGDKTPPGAFFRTSDRCVACHNGLTTSSGEDVSIGFEWRASIMANSSRDPYWQGSVRRESIDHPESKAAIENECSTCHMPAVHFRDRDEGRQTQVFSRLPLQKFPKGDRAAADGVTCSVCHQIEKTGLGTPATFVGNVVIAKPIQNDIRPEYGPFDVDKGHQTVMHSSTATYLPTRGDHIRDAGLCGSCHTLITASLGPNGEKVARFPEQVPFQEWQHSNYATTQTCQECHMPLVNESVAVTALYGQPREGMHRHVFVGSNFVMEGMLQDHRDELATEALPEEMDAAIKRTAEFLKTQAAKVTITHVDPTPNGIEVNVHVENLGGHKLPTAYPSRRAWLHVAVRDSSGRMVFESGALNPDGSIVGNHNDQDPLKFEPHYREITSPQQVEIYEPILKDSEGKVTTGLLHAVGYLKDNRLLPHGFDKATAEKDIAVTGDAADDPDFTDTGSSVRYVVSTGNATGPFKIEAELWFQPIGFRWAHNLAPYQADEPQRLVRYYEAAAQRSAMVLAKAEATH